MKKVDATYIFILAVFLVLLSACKSSTTSSQASLNTNSSSCILGKWSDSSLPLNIKISNDFTGDFTGESPLEQMAQVWNQASTRTLINTPFPKTSNTGYETTASFRDSEIGIYKSYTWFPNVSSSALAITQFYGVVTSSPGLGQFISLTHADIVINYRDYGPRLTMIANPMIDFDVPTVVLHEMGHLLGLCHETKSPSIMAPFYLTTQRSLQAKDIDSIRDVYVDGAISAISEKNINTNALNSPLGTEIKGIIELKENGMCNHYINGKKVFEHSVYHTQKK